MPTLILRRSAPLTAAEASRLPPACAFPDEGDVIASASVEAPLAELLALAAAMARAVPDARFEAHVPASAASIDGVAIDSLVDDLQSGALVPSAQEPMTEDDADFESLDPWALLDAGDVNRALARFQAGWTLDAEGRDRVFSLSRDPDPNRIAIALHVARFTGYKTFIMNIRRLAAHEDPRVRAAAARAMGTLGGRSQLVTLERLRDDDKVPAVREAAAEGIKDIESRQG